MSNETLSLKSKKEATGGATVTVGSKLPMDLTLQLYDFKTKHEPVVGGGSREYKIAEQRNDAPKYVVIGNSYAQNQGPHCQISGGFAITHGIPKDFWDEWLSQHSSADFIVNGMIFAHAEAASTIAESKEKEGLKSNLERLDPNNLPKGLKTADEAATRRAA